jgi:hypothetical protein
LDHQQIPDGGEIFAAPLERGAAPASGAKNPGRRDAKAKHDAGHSDEGDRSPAPPPLTKVSGPRDAKRKTKAS